MNDGACLCEVPAAENEDWTAPASPLDQVKGHHETSVKKRHIHREQTWLSKIKQAPSWTALYLPNDKCSFSYKAGLKEEGRGDTASGGRKREGFPRHLGDLGEETLKQHSLNHTVRYHQGSLFVYVCVHICVRECVARLR